MLGIIVQMLYTSSFLIVESSERNSKYQPFNAGQVIGYLADSIKTKIKSCYMNSHFIAELKFPYFLWNMQICPETLPNDT